MKAIRSPKILSKKILPIWSLDLPKFVIAIFLIQFLPICSLGQQPPLPVELFGGNRAMYYQHVLNKNLFGDKFNFFNVTSFEAEHENNQNNIFVVSNLFSYNLGKGFSVGIGGEIQRPGTFAIVGAQYAYVTKTVLLVIFPSMNINGDKEYTHFTLFEYKPNLSDKLKGYFRSQFLVITDFENYNRGYQQLRLGLQLDNIQFGLATNFDQFDNNKVTKSNYGLFIRALIF
ncbi:MAG: hypothetical protein AAGH81_03540 [Bacteroidota bacterium]